MGIGTDRATPVVTGDWTCLLRLSFRCTTICSLIKMWSAAVRQPSGCVRARARATLFFSREGRDVTPALQMPDEALPLPGWTLDGLTIRSFRSAFCDNDTVTTAHEGPCFTQRFTKGWSRGIGPRRCPYPCRRRHGMTRWLRTAHYYFQANANLTNEAHQARRLVEQEGNASLSRGHGPSSPTQGQMRRSSWPV